MEWLSANWFWVLIFALFIVMHMFGHGGHGGHGGHEGHGTDDDQSRAEKGSNEGPTGGHRHH
ncbi:MAG: DUF2933 domain-containing protein [bacterium]